MSERRRPGPAVGSKYNTKAIKNKTAKQAAVTFESAGFIKLNSLQAAAQSAAKENCIILNPSKTTQTDSPATTTTDREIQTTNSAAPINTNQVSAVKRKPSSWFVLSDNGNF